MENVSKKHSRLSGVFTSYFFCAAFFNGNGCYCGIMEFDFRTGFKISISALGKTYHCILDMQPFNFFRSCTVSSSNNAVLHRYDCIFPWSVESKIFFSYAIKNVFIYNSNTVVVCQLDGDSYSSLLPRIKKPATAGWMVSIQDIWKMYPHALCVR